MAHQISEDEISKTLREVSPSQPYAFTASAGSEAPFPQICIWPITGSGELSNYQAAIPAAMASEASCCTSLGACKPSQQNPSEDAIKAADRHDSSQRLVNGCSSLESDVDEEEDGTNDNEACGSEPPHCGCDATESDVSDDEGGHVVSVDIAVGHPEKSNCGGKAGDDQIKEYKAEVFPVAAHKCGDHNHAHPHATQRIIRVPDGHQLFSVLFKISFNDAKIEYVRNMASISSMTDNVANSAGLHELDFEHLYRLIDIRFVDFVAGMNPVKKSKQKETRNLFQRYTVELDLSTSDGDKRDTKSKTFLNYGRELIATEAAKEITAKLEDMVLDAIEVVDRLATERKLVALNDPDCCPYSVILDSEARRALGKERRSERRIFALESNMRSIISEMRAAEWLAADKAAPSRPVAAAAAVTSRAQRLLSHPAILRLPGSHTAPLI